MTKKKTPAKKLVFAAATSRQERLRKFLAKTQNRLPLVKSLALHILVIVAFSLNWHHGEKVQAVVLPSHIQAKVIDASQVEYLQKQKKLKQQEAEKKRRALLKEKKKLEAARKKEAMRKKALAKKKALLVKKKAEEKKRKLARKKAEKERAAKEKARKEKLKKEKLEKERLAKEKAEAEKKEALRKKREEALLQTMQAAEQERIAREKALAEEKIRQQELAAAEKARLLIEAGEKERFAALIKQRIESRWHRPPGTGKGYSVQLRLRLLPTGELEDVAITNRSGSAVFDQSALQAARSVKIYPVPKENLVFEKYFRSFALEFKPDN